MRQIKFRGWDNQTNEMLSPEQMLAGDGLYFAVSGKNNAVIPMQYTGLLDKHGKEIYEGDIVALPLRFDGDSTYQPSVSKVVWDYDGWYVEDRGECPYERLEVIGNVYENPELLKK